MSLWLDIKYSKLINTRVKQFKIKQTTPFQASMKCPVCGDSKKHNKVRGYLFERSGMVMYYCHNCFKSWKLPTLLRFIDTSLYNEYMLECVAEGKPTRKVEFESQIENFTVQRFQKYEALKSLKRISQLNENHPAKKYILKRQIPTDKHYKLYYAPKFKHWVNSILPGKFENEAMDEPRLVIPFVDTNGYCFGFTGRSFDPKTQLRYITIMLDENKPKIYGLDSIDFTKRVYCVEGPLDSLFINNCIAMAGADIRPDLLGSNTVFIFDNEPRNVAIVKKLERYVNSNYNVVIWPKKLHFKDINDMILGGYTQTEIASIINDNTFVGLEALIKFGEWKKT